MRQPHAGIALILLTIGCGDGLVTPTQEDPVASATQIRTAASSITQAKILSWLSVIADDSMGGRNSPSIGLEKTAQFLADKYRVWGLLPAGEDNDWFQRYALQTKGTNAPNVVAMVRGSDPVLRDEFVVFSAHMDHVGTSGDGIGGCNAVTRTDGTVDRICNGADDNGSGTIAVLAIAEAVKKLNGRTLRSIVVLNVSAEEKGLLGSAYFTDHPTVPMDKIVADINIDMIGRNHPDSIVAVGNQYSDLGPTITRVAAAHPELQLIVADDIWPAQNNYRRSDHYRFALKGVPALFLFDGSHPQVHRADDEVGLINAGKLVRVAQLAFYFGIEIANIPARPQMYPANYQAITAGWRAAPGGW